MPSTTLDNNNMQKQMAQTAQNFNAASTQHSDAANSTRPYKQVVYPPSGDTNMMNKTTGSFPSPHQL